MSRLCCNWYWNIYHFFTPQISFEFSILFEARKSNFKVNLYACDTRCVWVCSSCRECASNQHLTKINWKLQIFNRFPKLTSSKFFFSNGIRCASFPSIIHLSMARSIYYVDLYIYFFRFSSTVSHHSVVFVEIIFFFCFEKF